MFRNKIQAATKFREVLEVCLSVSVQAATRFIEVQEFKVMSVRDEMI
jgi:hypothetical protein